MKCCKLLTLFFYLFLNHDSFSATNEDFNFNEIDIDLDSNTQQNLPQCSNLDFLEKITKDQYNALVAKVHKAIDPELRLSLNEIPTYESLGSIGINRINNLVTIAVNRFGTSSSCFGNDLSELDQAFVLAAEDYYAPAGEWAKHVGGDYIKNMKWYNDHTFEKLENGDLNPVAYGTGSFMSVVGAVIWNVGSAPCSFVVGTYNYIETNYDNCINDIKTTFSSHMLELREDYIKYFKEALKGYLGKKYADLFFVLFLNNKGLCRFYGSQLFKGYKVFLSTLETAAGPAGWAGKGAQQTTSKFNVIKKFKEKINSAREVLKNGGAARVKFALKTGIEVSQGPNNLYSFIWDTAFIKIFMDPTNNYQNYKDLCNCVPRGL